jgi:hypothetical protein
MFNKLSTEESYQWFLEQYLVNGNPGSWWPKGVYGPEIKNVLSITKKFGLITDQTNKESECGTVIDALGAATALDGLVPPEGVVKNGIIDLEALGARISRHF